MPTKLGDKYLVAPYSVDRHLSQLKEFAATSVATDRDQPRLVATSVVEENKSEMLAEGRATQDDMSRPVATSPDNDRYVVRLEGEVEFLRGQISTKDAQIKEFTERSRETNFLIQGLQTTFARLLGKPDEPKQEP